jgi:hypothetical protein
VKKQDLRLACRLEITGEEVGDQQVIDGPQCVLGGDAASGIVSIPTGDLAIADPPSKSSLTLHESLDERGTPTPALNLGEAFDVTQRPPPSLVYVRWTDHDLPVLQRRAV